MNRGEKGPQGHHGDDREPKRVTIEHLFYPGQEQQTHR